VSRKKLLLMILPMLVVVLSVFSGVLRNVHNYILVDMKVYPRDAQYLDLRDQKVTVRHYEKLHRRIPACEILWNVPFQQAEVACDVKEITITELTERDIRTLDYLEHLETVHAESCSDYENLLKLRARRPDLKVEYTVLLGSERYSDDAEQIVLDTVAEEDISRLTYLPKLKRILCGGGAPESVSMLQEYCQTHGVEFLIDLGGTPTALTAKTVTAGAATEEQLGMLQFLPNLEQLHLRYPKVSAQKLLELRQNYPSVAVTWEQEVCGKLFHSTEEELDLSDVKITGLETLDQEMAYFPDTQRVFLGECGLENELLAAHRERVRDRYKLVWTVSCGKKLKTRTDATTFMPVREHVYYFNDEEAYNLRYCEDMVCMDIGHMSIWNIDFVEYMPNLEYLILAHTQVQYIEPIRSCKKLKFLELDWTPIRDLTPLKDCTALEDLNLGNTFADFTPVGEMDWLKNLWMVDCSTGDRYRMTQALPKTRVMVTGSATVANGWRNLDNYYKMRDLLGMHYMSW